MALAKSPGISFRYDPSGVQAAIERLRELNSNEANAVTLQPHLERLFEGASFFTMDQSVDGEVVTLRVMPSTEFLAVLGIFRGSLN